MNIGIDLDDVVYNTSAEVEKEIEKANNPRLFEFRVQLMRGALSEMPSDVAQFLKDTIISYTSNAKPIKNALDTLKKLRDDGHVITIITARSDAIRDGVVSTTLDSLKKYGIDKGKLYDKIIFEGANKGDVCEKEKIDLFVDDSPINCIHVRERGINVLAFKSGITAEAIDQTDLPSVSSWDELYDKINSIV
jgi:uncharacterized HAD superfamily protein